MWHLNWNCSNFAFKLCENFYIYLICLIPYTHQSIEWPSLVCYDYNVTKVCSIDKLPITSFSFGIKMMVKSNTIEKNSTPMSPFGVISKLARPNQSLWLNSVLNAQQCFAILGYSWNLFWRASRFHWVKHPIGWAS